MGLFGGGNSKSKSVTNNTTELTTSNLSAGDESKLYNVGGHSNAVNILSSDHGAIQGAFKFAGQSADSALAISRAALSGNERTAYRALSSNERVNTRSLASNERTTNRALGTVERNTNRTMNLLSQQSNYLDKQGAANRDFAERVAIPLASQQNEQMLKYGLGGAVVIVIATLYFGKKK